jgi:hypothetical protein
MTQMLMPNITAKITVRRSRFFSHMPEPAVALYMEAAIISDTPVPLPECMSTRMIVKIAEMAMMTRSTMFRGPT